MSIGETDVDFKEIYDAINDTNHPGTSGTPIGMDSFYDQSFSDGGSTPSSGAISIGDMKGKTIQEPYLIEWHPTSTSGKTGSQISITGSGLNTVIKSTATNTRTNVYFTSKTQIYDNTSIKFQSVITGIEYTNVMLGIGDGTFTDFTDPRNDILYALYFNGGAGTSQYIIKAEPSGYQTWYNLSYDTNTVFEIRIVNGYISFYKDNSLILNSSSSYGPITFSTPKYLMGTMWRNNSGVKNIFIPLYSFSSHTFTNCTATGQNGPTLANCTSSYSSSTWTSNTNYFNVTNGIQEWTVPNDGTYRIQVWGAQGGQSGGYGAYTRGDFILTRGDIIYILIGQTGGTSGGGGGGTFVMKSPYNSVSSVLIIAGGGGGGYGAADGGDYIFTRGNSGESGSSGYQSGIHDGTYSGKGGSNGGGGGAGSASDNSYSTNGGGAGGDGIDGGNTNGTSPNAGAG